MATCITGLGGEVIAFTYPGLIKTADNFNIPTIAGGNRTETVVFCNDKKTATPNALVRLSDGSGNPASIAVGQTTAGAKIFGPTVIDGVENFNSGEVLTICNGGVCITDSSTGNIRVDGSGDNKLCGTTCTNDTFACGTLCVIPAAGTGICGAQIKTKMCVDGDTAIHGETFLNQSVLVQVNATICGHTELCSTLDAASNNFCVGATGNITTNGSLCVAGAGGITTDGDIVAFYSSDKNLKNNIIKITDSNSVLNSINGYEFDWNEKSNREGHDYGVIAQEVQKVAPTLVKERDDGYLAVDYIKIIPVLIEEVKSLNNRIKVLEEK